MKRDDCIYCIKDMIDSELTQVPSDEEYKMTIKLSATEDSASLVKEDENRNVLDTTESEDIDLEALMQRYQGSLSVSMSGEDSEKAASAESDILDEDEYAARANDIMKRYKIQYSLSDDSEQISTVSNVGKEEENSVVDEESEPFQEFIEDRAEELVNQSRQILRQSTTEEENEENDKISILEEVNNLLENVEIGEELGSETFAEDTLGQVEPESMEKNNQEQVAPEQVDGVSLDGEVGAVEIGEEIQEENESGSFVGEIMKEVEIGEEIKEENFETSAIIAAAEIQAEVDDIIKADVTEDGKEEANAVTTEVETADVEETETTSEDVHSSEDLEDMINKLTQENEELKKKKELKKRIYELSQENDQLKMSPQRTALAKMACKFDDAVATAVAKVSKIMVCAPEDEDIFESEEGFSQMAEENAGDFVEYKPVQVLSPVSHMTDENTNYFQTAQARPNSYQLKMQVYNDKYPGHIKAEPAITVNEVLQEARIASGAVPTEESLALATRRVEEAKMYIKNRSVLKPKANV